jgi:hypothetical protein
MLRFSGGEDAEQQGLRHRHQESAEDSLTDPASDQHTHRHGYAAEEGADPEPDHAEQEGAHRSEPAGDPAGQRHADRLGDGVGGDNPRALLERDAEIARDVRDRDVGDGQVENDHEIGKGSTSPATSCRDGGILAPDEAVSLIGCHSPETSISTSIESPTRNGCLRSSAGSSSIRTGRRWTVLIQLPVAFWAGMIAIDDPVPPASPVTLP